VHLLRWLLVLPLVLGGVYVALFVGFYLMRGSDQLCRWLGSPESVCVLGWNPVAETIVAAIGAVIAVLLGVLVPASVAPSSNVAVAVAGALVNLTLALAIIVVLAFPVPLAALSSSLVAVLAVRTVSRRQAKAT
jgi:hypothetical protein